MTDKLSITVRLDAETVAFLDRLAKVEDRDRSYMIKQAVANFVQLHRWQIEEIKKALAEAEAGDFASDEEVSAMFDELSR